MNEILKLIGQLDENSKNKILHHFSKQAEVYSLIQEDHSALLETAKCLLLKNQEQNRAIIDLKQKLAESEIADILQIRQTEWQDKYNTIETQLQAERERLRNSQQECCKLTEALSVANSEYRRLLEEKTQLDTQLQQLQKSLDMFVDLLKL